MTINIAQMTEQERREIELSKHASLLINQLKQKKISRSDIHREIEALELGEQETFKGLLNKFREGK